MNLNTIIDEYLKSPECENLIEFHAGVKINYDLDPNLLNIIRQNHDRFAIIPNIDWAANIFEVIERSRNVIMHSGRISQGELQILE